MMSDGEGSTTAQPPTTAMETGGGQPATDSILLTAPAATVIMGIDEQQTVAITKDDGEPNPKKAKLSAGGSDVFGRGGVANGGGCGDKQTALDKLEHRLGGILCCAVCLDLPRSAIYQVSGDQFWLIVFVVILFLVVAASVVPADRSAITIQRHSLIYYVQRYFGTPSP